VVVMRDGRIQQVGTPLEVYGNPANRFVAGFIGAPAMNFIEVTIGGDDGALFAETQALRFPVAAAGGGALAAFRGRRVHMGVRPEHLALGNDGMCRFEAVIEVIEQLGSEIILETRVGDASWTVARVDPQARVAAGEKVSLSVPPGRLHFFDPATETAIR
jgi:multiple sugar transport system ATP-binding protein